MTIFQTDSKGVQTDPSIRHARSKFVKTLLTYILAVNRYRLHLLSRYIQADEHQDEHRELINVRKEILNRFSWVINELEQTIENLQARRLSVGNAQQYIDRPFVKEVIDASLNVNIPLNTDRQRPMPSADERIVYQRDLRETKQNLFFLDLLVHRGILKVDQVVKFSNQYV